MTYLLGLFSLAVGIPTRETKVPTIQRVNSMPGIAVGKI
jgi:hypothetical protein